MGNLSKPYESDYFSKRYSGRIILYVESKEDLDVLKERWFRSWGEWVTFQSVDIPQGGGGGSTQVCFDVQADRNNKVLAYGIVDRDSLLNHQITGENSDWSVFFESDHNAFDAATANHFGPYIKVLRRYEMENYLLHPVAIEEVLKDSEVKGKPPLPCSPGVVPQCMLDFSAMAILLTAANLVLLKEGKEPLSPLYEQSESNLEKFQSSVLQQLDRKGVTSPETKLAEKILAIHAFLRDTTGEPEKRWNQLNHLIDGKLFLKRFTKWFGLHDSIRLHLASRISDQNLIDQEIRDFMEAIKTKAEEMA